MDDKTRIGVVGLGAIGGLAAFRLAEAGHAVTGFARGETLAAVQRDGLRLLDAKGERSLPLPATDDPAAIGPLDMLLVALKGPALSASAAHWKPLIGPRTIVVPMMNGVPWWFLQPLADHAGRGLESVDPGGRIAAALPLDNVLGCVVHLASSCPAPGVVRHAFGERLIVGEPAGGVSPRVREVAALLARAGFQVEPCEDVRREIWFKLWGNMTVNPISALTGATADRILDDPLVADFMLRAMAEAAEVGARIGCRIEQSGPDRMAVTRRLGAFKTSMLQDAEAGRPIELDALVGAVHEIAGRIDLAIPNIAALFGLTRLMRRGRGLYPS